jgi:hypothetical protein
MSEGTTIPQHLSWAVAAIKASSSEKAALLTLSVIYGTLYLLDYDEAMARARDDLNEAISFIHTTPEWLMVTQAHKHQA